MTDALILQDVTKRYGSFTAVDRFNLRLPAGQVLGFLGPNGAGKTTTIRMIMSIIGPDEGHITILGQPRALAVKDRIGYLPEERGLYRKMTIQEILSYFGRLKGLDPARLHHRIDECLDRIGLADWRRKRVETLSKGMSQKLQFITAIIQEPELVILDEPFSGLDPLNIDMLEKLIADLRTKGTTVIFSTHQMNQAERLCDRIVLINRGKKIIEGSIHEVRTQFAARVALVDGEGDLSQLANLPGVIDAQTAGGHARLELAENADPNHIARLALDHIKLLRFEIERPDLQTIFVKLVGEPAAAPAEPVATPDAGEVNHV